MVRMREMFDQLDSQESWASVNNRDLRNCRALAMSGHEIAQDKSLVFGIGETRHLQKINTRGIDLLTFPGCELFANPEQYVDSEPRVRTSTTPTRH